MDKDEFAKRRKSYIDIGEIFFWTAAITNWQRLLLKEDYEKVIINSLWTTAATGTIIFFKASKKYYFFRIVL
ncbi:MAG: hypothetical protein ACTHK0_18800 [Ginsengibacter sp.]